MHCIKCNVISIAVTIIYSNRHLKERILFCLFSVSITSLSVNLVNFHETDGYKSASIDIAIAGLKAANCEFIHFTHISHNITLYELIILFSLSKPLHCTISSYLTLVCKVTHWRYSADRSQKGSYSFNENTASYVFEGLYFCTYLH